jgi:tetratricopeptide (TPR) repeat protein
MVMERFAEALASYDKALAIRPDYATALNNRGTALTALKRSEEALASYDQALAIRPDFARDGSIDIGPKERIRL